MLYRNNKYKLDRTSRTLFSNVFKDPLDKEHFGSYFSLAQYDWAYRKIIEFARKDDYILDWGCGNGHFSLFLQENKFTNIYGYSYDDPCLIHTLKKANFNYLAGDSGFPNKMKYKDNTFSVVCSIGVLEHVRETNGTELECLKEIHRILKDQGLFLCAHFPNKFSWIEALARLHPNKKAHKYRYQKKDIYYLLKKSGFRILELKSYGFFPRNSFSGKRAFLGNNFIIFHFLNILDSILSYIFPLITQNYGFICIKL